MPGAPNGALDTPIQFVKGVGPRLGSLFQSREISTVRDLLFFFPRQYEDRTKLLKVSELQEGSRATCKVVVRNVRQIPLRGRYGKSILEVRTSDETGTLNLKWFHAPRGMAENFNAKINQPMLVTGNVKLFMSRPEVMHPEVSFSIEEMSENVGRVVPIYTELEGISSRVFRKILWAALEKFGGDFIEDLPQTLLEHHRLPKLSDSVREIHFPEKSDVPALIEFRSPAHQRLIYEEFLKFEYLVLKQRLRMEKQAARVFGKEGGSNAVTSLEKQLPFTLTGAQKRAIQEILKDLSQPHPMNRLIQGDVGSGKTAVAFLSAGAVLAEGGQAALMAPTEILAEQHFKNAVKLFDGKLNVALLLGKTPASERGKLYERLASGEPILVIGTHALIEDEVQFRALSYVLIDEQHRFGVEQRRTLRKKGLHTDPETGKLAIPHNLILTATPIPRTLALTAYGDLSVTSIRELPPGRTPVETRVIRGAAEKIRTYGKIREELEKGHQAYFIYPLVNESEAEGFTHLKSAVAEAERLQKDVFPEFKVGLLHGQQKADEKAAIMERFKRNELNILVSTTVVEVGVDVPNATIIAIEHCERFGLSQLHQLRGRVGRGAKQSYCFLLAGDYLGETTTQRLDVLEKTTDGFEIAEADLEIRGPGEFLGTRQSGSLPFRLANLVRDQDWLLKARDDATQILRDDPELLDPAHQPLRKFFEREGKLQSERLKTS